MKLIYKKILNWLLMLPVFLETVKSFFAEWIAIFKKYPLYKNIKWSKEQQKEFDVFWKCHYGKKISNRWHRLYEACNGVHRIDYFPEILYSTKLQKKVNAYSYCRVFSNKSINDLLFNNKIKGVTTPNYFVFNDNGIYYDENRKIVSLDNAVELLKNVGEVVIKPTVDSSSGNGVKILNIQNGINIRDNQDIKSILLNYKMNFIVQEKIRTCNQLETLYPNAVNTVRVISYICDNKICVAPISLRIGGGGGEIDNIHAGGMVISVDDSGNLGKLAYRLGWGDNFETFTKHPDTNVVFENYNLSFVHRMIDAAKKLHTKTSNVGIISWDFTVDDQDNIVVIEANYLGQSIWFPQMISGKSFFGDNTAEILRTLKN
ncbi:MAG: hypothetical protein IJ027_04140 [Oscillospiraceae bacterium]|nr:hypothetical protein [Oscillospiraceae bacterium]